VLLARFHADRAARILSPQRLPFRHPGDRRNRT